MINRIIEFIKLYFNWRWVLTLALVLISADIFLELAGDVWLEEGFIWDEPIMLAIHDLSSPTLDPIVKFITDTAGMPFVIIPLIWACAWLWWMERRYQVYTLIFSVIGMGFITGTLKLIFQRPRPDFFEPLVTVTSYSFPSGHTGAAVALFGLLGVFLWIDKHRIWAVVSFIWMVLVMLSRIYLGAHYPSDVLASLALGVIWITLLIWNNQRRITNPDPESEQD